MVTRLWAPLSLGGSVVPKPSAPEDICNLTLDFLKQSPIASIESPVSNTEFIMARWYDIERLSALRSHPWKFASKRVLLSPNLNTPPPFGFSNAYDLPIDYVRMISIGDDHLRDMKMDHVIESGQLLTPSGSNAAFPNVSPTDTSTIYLRYVYDCQTVSQFDPLFAKFFALGMALDLAPKFAISAGLGNALQVIFDKLNTEAKTVNGQDAPIQRIQQSRILTKRRGLPGGIYASRYTVFDS